MINLIIADPCPIAYAGAKSAFKDIEDINVLKTFTEEIKLNNFLITKTKLNAI
jgi:hypothetical protein